MSSNDVSIFMCYADVRGEATIPGTISKAPASGGWMELLTVEFGASVNYGQRTSTHKDGAEATAIRVRKQTDASTTGLLRHALLGEHDKGVVIVFLRTGSGTPDEYMRVELKGAGISEVSLEGGAEDRTVEAYAISFAEIEIINWSHDGAKRGPLASVSLINQA